MPEIWTVKAVKAVIYNFLIDKCPGLYYNQKYQEQMFVFSRGAGMDIKKILVDYVGKDVYVCTEAADGSRTEYVIHCYRLVRSPGQSGDFYRIVSGDSEEVSAELDLSAELTGYHLGILLVDVEAKSGNMNYHMFIADRIEDI